jgi:predicted DsbA family dithiol-disulfide isomerase
MQLVHYTDAACPFAYSAEPQRLRLLWHYGDQLQWTTRLVVLSTSPDELAARGLTTELLAKTMDRMQREHGMPFDTSERDRLAAALPACRAVAATQVHAPEHADALLRQLRRTYMCGEGLIDEQDVIDRAAAAVGIDPGTLADWIGASDTQTHLEEGMEAARTPLQAAKALDHKLAPAGDGRRRYSTPTYELHLDGRAVVVPGFQPWESYEVAIANLDPSLERSAAAEDAAEVLEWAPHPLATAEVAAILGSDLDGAREQLAASGAAFEPVGSDGFWSAA